jgi:hypothetical protein
MGRRCAGHSRGYWKPKFGDHRVIYRIYPPTGVVFSVGPRKAGDADDMHKELNAVTKTGRLTEQVASVLHKARRLALPMVRTNGDPSSPSYSTEKPAGW